MSAIRYPLTLRNQHAQLDITAAGAGAKLKGFNGAVPAGVGGAVPGTNNQLCMATFGATCGVVDTGKINWDEAGAVQVPANFVNGVPTYFDLTTSADALVARYEVNTVDGWTWSGTVQTGQPFALNGLETTMPGAT